MANQFMLDFFFINFFVKKPFTHEKYLSSGKVCFWSFLGNKIVTEMVCVHFCNPQYFCKRRNTINLKLMEKKIYNLYADVYNPELKLGRNVEIKLAC